MVKPIKFTVSYAKDIFNVVAYDWRTIMRL